MGEWAKACSMETRLQDSSRVSQTAHLKTRGLRLPFPTLLLQAGLITTPTCLVTMVVTMVVTLVMVPHTTDKAKYQIFQHSIKTGHLSFISLRPTFDAGHLDQLTS